MNFCAAQLNNNTTVITGGGYHSSSYPNYHAINEVWFYYWTTNNWMQGPSMNQKRGYHVCIGMTNGNILAAGGKDDDGNYYLAE